MKCAPFVIILFFLTNSLFAQYRVQASVFSTASSIVSNASLQNNSTIGQALIGEMQDNDFMIQTGGQPVQKVVTPVEKEPKNTIPKEYKLFNNYPNPFNPTTVIRYNLPSAQHVILQVYDILGQLVATLVDKTQNAGSYTIHFDAHYLTSGMYIYRIKAGSFTETKKMMLIK